MSVFPSSGHGRQVRHRSLFTRVGRVFDAVRGRMMAIILLAAMPIALIGAVQAWHSYHSTLEAPGERTDLTVSRIDLELRHEADHLGSLLQAVSRMRLDDAGLRHMLELVQSLTGRHYSQIALADDRGNILTAVGRQGDAPALGADAMPRFQGDVRMVALTDPLTHVPGYFRITVSAVIYDDAGRPARPGYLTAVMPLSWRSAILQASDPRLDLVQQNGPIQIWVVDSQARAAAPLCSDCNWAARPPDRIMQWARVTLATGGDHAHITLPEGSFSIGRVQGGVHVLTMTRRNAGERHAVVMFAISLVSSGLLLLAGLLGASKSADVLVITPLRQLTASVNQWQLGGMYEVRSNWAMPLEVRQLAHAFSKATRRLARHEKRLERAQARQELLLKEMHHRVKNNLQIVASLLNLQAGRIRQPAAREEFAQARDRVRALATLHRYLYADGELYSLNMQSFVRELCGQIMHAIGESDESRITLDIRVDDLLMVPDQAVPLALIVTEAVSNTIKYAFPDRQHGTLEVGLRALSGDRACLWIADNGVGMAAARNHSAAEEGRSGIGMQLIRGFARQLGGELQMFEENGTRYVLVFPLKQPEQDETSA
ncbi:MULTISPECIES: sensor histidine kinase [Komagataeibacter]|uniref:histidine kinase n=2 Tax=Komagataeibacter TaxID=1434011 RepID=A0A0D6Q6T6_KOMXY|nr:MULTISPECIES: histidine kinase dimerization/phosphoacceptor domain -containing protein [Komagataeibacter]MBL7232978.1 sensor histidine kinase [Komagataeibacter oboediens]MBV0888491.1 sensor histidine kinase [Komagataeibacter oboediens]MBV1823823.1 sensor histidine kinase [Komagataeibacter oboediens]MCK9819217.1 sensor histidine kinase [Komagataeibacter oboediens]WEQ53661.1 histidine kinase dimerization/phosphoacceptor domain -containing protein [Komagataeibacter oboediens]